MDIKTLNLKIKKKIFDNISCQSLSIEDKTFLHEKHKITSLHFTSPIIFM